MPLTILLLSLALAAAAQPGRVTVRPADTGAALVNPGMGWVFHHYDNSIGRYGLDLAPSDTVEDFPGASTVYLRLAWSYLEPEEGRFDWAVVDTPAQRWIAKGRKVAFRFTSVETDRNQPYATPKWVRDAGSRGYMFTPSKGEDPNGTHWEPDFDDPVFLHRLDRFVAAAAARYDGDPNVAFIDIGSMGAWGEGHTFATTRRPYSAATMKRHMDIYAKHFRRTQLALIDDFAHQGRGLEVIHYGRDLGMAFRDDSILVEAPPKAWHREYLAPLFWPTLPVILEMEHYGPSKERGAWGDGALYLEAIERHHASYATVHWYPRQFLDANRALVDRINLRLGYRLQLVEASWPESVPVGGAFPVGYRWQNAGVAPCLPGGYPAVTLKDERGGIAAVLVDEDFDMRTLPVGEPGRPVPVARETQRTSQASRALVAFRVPPDPVLKPGRYTVYISVGTRIGTPTIALPLAEDDGARRYRLGSVVVTQ